MDNLINTVTQGDCLEVMKRMPDNHIDIILTDPPYGIDAANYKRANTKYGKSMATCKDYGVSNWDKQIPAEQIFKEMFRVSKNQIICGGNYFIQYLKPSSCWVVWDKDNGNNGYADCELIWTSFNTAVRKIVWKWHGMLQQDMKNKEPRHHPTQKPAQLFIKILNMYAKETDLICDPFAGSFTTAIAAIKTNRNWVCIEQEEKYCEIGRQRIKEELSQGDMFRTIDY